MIIGVKYWALGASVPASWTDIHVSECFSTRRVYTYDDGEALDGTEFKFKRKRYRVKLSIDPFSFNHATYGPVATALREAHYCRIKDTRYTWLGDTNAINFLVPDSEEDRDELSLLTRSVDLDMTAESLYT
jgi:hypothetical protein